MHPKFAFLAVAALSLPMAAQQQTVTCTAAGAQPQFCPADTHNGVLLVREQSNGVCRQGTTWVASPRGIRVSGGCSADFLVNNGDAGSGYNRTGNNGYGTTDRGYGNGSGGNNGSYANNGNSGAYNGQGDDRRDGDRRDGGRRAVSLPAGTEVSVRLEQTVRPAEIHDGDTLPVTLNSDLRVDSRVVAPRGTPAFARVSQGQNSALEIRLDSLSVNGQRYVLATNAVHGLRDSVGGAGNGSGQSRNGLGTFLGALEGGPEMPVGTVFNFRLVSQSVPTSTGN